ncbi:MAG: hypothetical protein IJO43_00280 [Bacilli bacterium]|nr:hypothetical protein [Bacilli bacterium]
MEKKNNKGVVISLLVVIAVLIVSITYMFISGTISLNSNEKDKCDVEVVEDDEINYLKQIPVKVLFGRYGDSPTNIILYDGAVYIRMEECFPKENILAYICDPVSNITTAYQKYNFEHFEYNMVFNYPLEDTEFVGLKLNVDDVKAIYSVEQGQANAPRSQGFVLVKNDGSVEMISYQDIFDLNLTPTKISDLKNIVNVVNEVHEDQGGPDGVVLGGGIYTYAIDSEGNRYNLYNYFN